MLKAMGQDGLFGFASLLRADFVELIFELV